MIGSILSSTNECATCFRRNRYNNTFNLHVDVAMGYDKEFSSAMTKIMIVVFLLLINVLHC